jgi:hypothetical protein
MNAQLINYSLDHVMLKYPELDDRVLLLKSFFGTLPLHPRITAEDESWTDSIRAWSASWILGALHGRAELPDNDFRDDCSAFAELVAWAKGSGPEVESYVCNVAWLLGRSKVLTSCTVY